MISVEPSVIESYVRTGKVRIVFRDVLNHGERSIRASEAAACAGEQDRFWEMHGILFEGQSDLYATPSDGEALVDTLKRFAASIEGLDEANFTGCLAGRRTKNQIEAADREQRARGIRSQPIFKIGDRRYLGLPSFEAIASVLDGALQ